MPKKQYEVNPKPISVLMGKESMLNPDGTFANYSIDFPKCPTCEAEPTYNMRFCPWCDQELLYPNWVEVEENGLSEYQFTQCHSCDSLVDIKGNDLSKEELKKRYYNNTTICCKSCKRVARGKN